MRCAHSALGGTKLKHSYLQLQHHFLMDYKENALSLGGCWINRRKIQFFSAGYDGGNDGGIDAAAAPAHTLPSRCTLTRRGEL
jgi:hypothetical protein